MFLCTIAYCRKGDKAVLLVSYDCPTPTAHEEEEDDSYAKSRLASLLQVVAKASKDYAAPAVIAGTFNLDLDTMQQWLQEQCLLFKNQICGGAGVEFQVHVPTAAVGELLHSAPGFPYSPAKSVRQGLVHGRRVDFFFTLALEGQTLSPEISELSNELLNTLAVSYHPPQVGYLRLVSSSTRTAIKLPQQPQGLVSAPEAPTPRPVQEELRIPTPLSPPGNRSTLDENTSIEEGKESTSLSPALGATPRDQQATPELPVVVADIEPPGNEALNTSPIEPLSEHPATVEGASKATDVSLGNSEGTEVLPGEIAVSEEANAAEKLSEEDTSSLLAPAQEKSLEQEEEREEKEVVVAPLVAATGDITPAPAAPSTLLADAALSELPTDGATATSEVTSLSFEEYQNTQESSNKLTLSFKFADDGKGSATLQLHLPPELEQYLEQGPALVSAPSETLSIQTEGALVAEEIAIPTLEPVEQKAVLAESFTEPEKEEIEEVAATVEAEVVPVPVSELHLAHQAQAEPEFQVEERAGLAASGPEEARSLPASQSVDANLKVADLPELDEQNFGKTPSDELDVATINAATATAAVTAAFISGAERVSAADEAMLGAQAALAPTIQEESALTPKDLDSQDLVEPVVLVAEAEVADLSLSAQAHDLNLSPSPIKEDQEESSDSASELGTSTAESLSDDEGSKASQADSIPSWPDGHPVLRIERGMGVAHPILPHSNSKRLQPGSEMLVFTLGWQKIWGISLPVLRRPSRRRAGRRRL